MKPATRKSIRHDGRVLWFCQKPGCNFDAGVHFGSDRRSGLYVCFDHQRWGRAAFIRMAKEER